MGVNEILRRGIYEIKMVETRRFFLQFRFGITLLQLKRKEWYNFFLSFFLLTFFLSAFQRMEFYLSQELPTGNLSFSFFLFFFSILFVFSCLLPFISVHLISSYFISLFLFRYTLHISVYSVCYCIFLDVLFDSSVIYFLIFCFAAYFILLFISCWRYIILLRLLISSSHYYVILNNNN